MTGNREVASEQALEGSEGMQYEAVQRENTPEGIGNKEP